MTCHKKILIIMDITRNSLMAKLPELKNRAAYGGDGWSPRIKSLKSEIGNIWEACGVSNEWGPLKAVLLHRPGHELGSSKSPDAVQMLQIPDAERAKAQHDRIANAYRQAGVAVHYVDPPVANLPNQMFVADLMFMTPEGAILARPASTVRSGEERWVCRRLADLGIPILRSIRGKGVFEGADGAWLSSRTVILGRGLRTNKEGALQVSAALKDMGVDVVEVSLPKGAMHLMGILRFADRDLALAWPHRLSNSTVASIKKAGYEMHFIPDEVEATKGFALNFVTLGPRQIMMPSGNPVTRTFYENLGITCFTVQIDELVKAAGAIGCLTGILERDSG